MYYYGVRNGEIFMAMGLVASAIGIAIAGIVIGAVTIPILSTVSTSGWSAINVTIWPFISTFMILTLLIGAMAGLMLGGQ
jgi:hypothetical protein